MTVATLPEHAQRSAPRVFVGLKIAPEIARELAQLAQDLERSAVRLVATADIHLTLVPPWNESSISETIEKLRLVAGRFAPFPLTFRHLGYGPQPRRPRLLWAECAASDEIAALHAALLAAYGQQDERPFRPHVTLARIRGNGSSVARKHPIDRELRLTQHVDSIELFQSPAPGASGYQVLASLRLGDTVHHASVMSTSGQCNVAAEPGEVPVRIFLCGDVMTGRGIDQALPHSCNPGLHESYVKSANHYVQLAEQANGSIARPVDFPYVWGTALDELKRLEPDARIINLETSITRSEDYEVKGINYRMSPENAGCLSAAGIDCCVLANNHVLDWGRAGLLDTLATLDRLRIKTTGAGRNLAEASAPAVLNVPGKCRVLVFSLASVTSGTPRSWAATQEAAGVNLLTDLSRASVARIADAVARVKMPHDMVVVSIHWGPNWGYEIPREQRWFAHALIEATDASIIHGHSSHHAKAMEVYRDRLILYGCGDFLNDYEGIGGYEDFRDDLALMYFVAVSPSSRNVVALELVALQIRQFRLIRPSREDLEWLRQTLDRESRSFGARVVATTDGRFALSWPSQRIIGGQVEVETR